MTIEALQAVQNVTGMVANSGYAASLMTPSIDSLAVAPGTDASGGFGQLVAQGLGQINQQLINSQIDLQKLAVGDVQNLHQVMIGLEETHLSFQLMMQVRNRMLEAYQDVMKMQI